MSQSAYMDLHVRVCGEETLSLVNGGTRRVWVIGQVTGDQSAMSDSFRYETIPFSEFHPWWTISPANDVCAIDHYEVVDFDAAFIGSSRINSANTPI